MRTGAETKTSPSLGPHIPLILVLSVPTHGLRLQRHSVWPRFSTLVRSLTRPRPLHLLLIPRSPVRHMRTRFFRTRRLFIRQRITLCRIPYIQTRSRPSKTLTPRPRMATTSLSLLSASLLLPTTAHTMPMPTARTSRMLYLVQRRCGTGTRAHRRFTSSSPRQPLRGRNWPPEQVWTRT